MEVNKILSKAKTERKKHKKLFERLNKQSKSTVDSYIHSAHQQVFSCIDCLKCANCCITTGPLFNNKDIVRIARYLKVKPGDFIQKYLKMDEDEDYVLQKVPCVFLDSSSNKCEIYDVRPKACAEYPHTDMKGQMKIKKLTLKNTEVCPAVPMILDAVEKKL